MGKPTKAPTLGKVDTMPRAWDSARLETFSHWGKVRSVSALYSFVALSFCLDDQNRVLLVQESRPDCRGQYYVPASRGQTGEDPVRIATRVTKEKTGITVEPIGVMGIEHNPPIGQYPGQLRVFVVARALSGLPKLVEDEHSMSAAWVSRDDMRGLKLRSDDFLVWLDDLVLGVQPVLSTAFWRTVGRAR